MGIEIAISPPVNVAYNGDTKGAKASKKRLKKPSNDGDPDMGR